MDLTTIQYDPCCKIDSFDGTSTDAYALVYSFRTDRHPSFVLQIINKHASNVLSWKVETCFEATSEFEIKAEADLAGTANAVFEDESIGIHTRVYVKSKVGGSAADFRIFLRLKPASFIV